MMSIVIIKSHSGKKENPNVLRHIWGLETRKAKKHRREKENLYVHTESLYITHKR